MLVTFRQFFQTLTFLGNYSTIPEILVSINGMGCGKLSGIIGYAQKFLSKYLRLSKSQIMFFFCFFLNFLICLKILNLPIASVRKIQKSLNRYFQLKLRSSFLKLNKGKEATAASEDTKIYRNSTKLDDSELL